ncbi:hypothetical protein [Methylosinus sp. Ce-a6]|uniref:hypothetical protein n=1 Tax=Methylosinus sp. Ce-a6 TaxID=2172005 RepID=UPI00135A1D39|nr:hypothetical protein [Methylosinus sp. Ce-a6]
MDVKKIAASAAPAALGEYLAREAAKTPHHVHGAGDHGVETVREQVHDGHKIVIRTRYEIEVDGKPLAAPIGVDDQGQVHCHSLPNYQTLSAVDMVKALIDNFPDDFPKRAPRTKSGAAKKPAATSKKSSTPKHHH